MHISDLGLHRGYGIFDFFRSRKGNLLWLEDYLDRLFNSILGSGFQVKFDRSDIKSIIQELDKKNNIANSAFKVIVTGGYSSDFGTVEQEPNLIVIQLPFAQPPPSTYSDGLNLITYSYQRPHHEIKSLNYYTALRLHQKLKEYKAADVLYHKDMIYETSRANVFCVEGKTIYTPEEGILNGITRKHVLSLAGEGFDFVLTDISEIKLFNFDEVFITSTTRDIAPVVNIDGKAVGDGKVGGVTKDLMQEFKKKFSF